MHRAYPKIPPPVINPAIHRGERGASGFGSEPFQRFIYALPSRETVETVADDVQPARIPAMNRGVSY